MKSIVTLITFLSLGFNYFGQKDFNEYKSLVAVGEMPDDFKLPTIDKIEKELEEYHGDHTKLEQKEFLQGIHYGIDDILHSGLVVYGDEVSLYVQAVAKKILVKRPELYEKLRFYTIKSNQTNALSTDQGIVFVTTGLISQLMNEAQLAFVLAHEISHYTEKHVVENYEFKLENRQYDKGIREFSIYSKEKELEADRLGVELYAEAGYNRDELLSSFEVLMYSYLPFDEEEVPLAYFNTPQMLVPEKFFPAEKFEIKAEEDYDDTGSSHPNIKKRKEQIFQSVLDISSANKTVFFLEESLFYHIRRVCRFESVRTDIVQANFADALYSIFLLEKEFPNSIFLARMKAQAWLGMVKFQENQKLSETYTKKSDLEGEVAAIHYFIHELDKKGLNSLALRYVYDLKNKYPNDKQLNAIYGVLLTDLAKNSSFKRGEYSTLSLEDAIIAFKEDKKKKTEEFLNSIANDTLKTTSKYDKIKSKAKKEVPDIEAEFDSSKFYLYGLYDIMSDSSFIKEFEIKEKLASIEKENRKKSEKGEDPFEMNFDKKEKSKESEIVWTDGLIVIEPMVFYYGGKKINEEKSEVLTGVFSNEIVSIGNENGLKIDLVSRSTFVDGGAEKFNERNAFYSYIIQTSRLDSMNLFPVDYEYLSEIQSKYGTSKVLFTSISYHYRASTAPISILAVLAFPSLLVYGPLAFATGHHCDMNLIVLDYIKGTIDYGDQYHFKDKPTKLALGAHMYSVFDQFKH